MMHSINKSFLILFFVIFANSPISAVAKDGLLWRIDTGSGKHSYLLGTIHSDDSRVTKLPPAVSKAFAESKSFSGEINMDMTTLLKASELMFMANGETLDKKLSPKMYREVVRTLVDYGIPEMLVQRMKPWAVAATLSLPKPRTGIFLDLKLYQMASSDQKALYGLETIEEQTGAMEAIPEHLQIKMIADALKLNPTIEQLIDSLIVAYISRDLNRIVQISDQAMKLGNQEVNKVFERELIVKRNHLMVSRMKPRLKEGHAFIAVGALHLPGENGLLVLLKKQGYRLTSVY
jgi:uncharacterized protein YbaP (TraB family)